LSETEGILIRSHSPEETLSLGQAIGEVMVGGLVIGLCGPLGAGKTQLVKGIALGNAIADVRQVTSPTFTLLQEYAGRLTLFHLDAYRLPNPRSLAALGFDELIRPDSVVIVEWADRALNVLPSKRIIIQISASAEKERVLALSPLGSREERVVVELQALVKNRMI